MSDQKPEKIQVPDGEGGHIFVNPGEYFHKEADAEKQQRVIDEEREKAHWHRVGSACERFDTLQKVAGKEMKLSEEEMVSAMYLSLLNWQYYYPEKLGGQARFSEICRATQAWFNDNKE
jgi:hypothetical protein